LKKKPAKGFLAALIKSFVYAFHGIRTLVKTQNNAWIHLAFTLLVVAGAALLHFSVGKWIALIVVVGFVWFAEAFNTALEHLVDLCSPGFHLKAQTAKDLGAAAVLFSAFTSILVGLLLFLPPIIQLLTVGK
jgi:diacylglycerol kinase